MRTNNCENINCEVMVDNLLNVNASMHDVRIISKTIVSIYPPRIFIAISWTVCIYCMDFK
jgi:hypothetical protein